MRVGDWVCGVGDREVECFGERARTWWWSRGGCVGRGREVEWSGQRLREVEDMWWMTREEEDGAERFSGVEWKEGARGSGRREDHEEERC